MMKGRLLSSAASAALLVRKGAREVRRRLGQPSVRPILASREAYAVWANSYAARPHNGLMFAEESAMLEILPDVRGRRVLDLACGSGRYAHIALERGAAQVVGVDNSLPMLGRAAGFARAQAEMTALPFASDSFDVVICGLATGHVSPNLLPAVFADVARVTRIGGTFIFSDLHSHLYLGGRRRTFTAVDGLEHDVEHYPHLISDYFAAMTAAGFVTDAINEKVATIDGSNVPILLVMAGRKRS
jgi:malonyl-CoA O-methyltransferase